MRVGEVVVYERKWHLRAEAGDIESDSREDVLREARNYTEETNVEVARESTAAFLATVVRHLEENERIVAIKYIREFTGLSLQDSKGLADRFTNLGRRK